MQKKINKQWHGYLLGLALPVITFFVIYLSLAGSYRFIDFIKYLNFKGDLSRALSLAVIPNLGLFFVFIWTNRLKAAQGVLGITILLALTIVLFRFF
jgi:hypothetical protein